MCQRYRMLGGDSGKTESAMPDSGHTPDIHNRHIHPRNVRLPECRGLNPKPRRHPLNTAFAVGYASCRHFLGRVREKFRRQTHQRHKGHGGFPNRE